MTRSAAKKNAKTRKDPAASLPFLEHLYELRRRLFFIAISVVGWSIAGYGVQQQIIELLLKPAKGQQFIYTSPGGGFDFLFRVTIYVGIVCSFPVIIYQLLRFLEPVIKDGIKFAALSSVASALLAFAGMSFGYLFGLPSALDFLLHQFKTEQISALITIQAYMSFVSLFLFGCAFIFQVPLILFLINRVSRLKTRTLLSMRIESWVITVSFVIAAIVNPSPRAQDMCMLALPMILAYHLGVAAVWYTNKYHPRRGSINDLSLQDAIRQAERAHRLADARPLLIRTQQTP